MKSLTDNGDESTGKQYLQARPIIFMKYTRFMEYDKHYRFLFFFSSVRKIKSYLSWDFLRRPVIRKKTVAQRTIPNKTPPNATPMMIPKFVFLEFSVKECNAMFQ